MDDEDDYIVACPHCGEDIHDEAMECPYCHQYISASDFQKSNWIQPVAIVLLIVFGLGTISTVIVKLVGG